MEIILIILYVYFRGFELPLATEQFRGSSGKISALEWQRVVSVNLTLVICLWICWVGGGGLRALESTEYTVLCTHRCMGKTK